MATSEPGQNIVALFWPCRVAVCQMGSPLHHAGLPVTAVSESVNRPGIAGSSIVFEMMP